MPPQTSTLPDGNPSLTPRRIGYGITTAAVALIVLVAAVDGLGGVAILGVDSRTVRSEADGLELAVTYGAVSRPALATPFDIVVTQPGGFDAPVRIAVDQEYMRLWDENGLTPEPSAETVLGPWLVWEFDPPIGDSLRVAFDARVEPAAQEGRSGAVAVLDGDDEPVVDVAFTTRVWP